MTTVTRPGVRSRADEPIEALWRAVLAGQEYAAVDVALAALGDGLDVEALLLDVIGAVQVRVGREWAANRLTVAQEHTATAINDRVIAALAHHPSLRRASGGELGRVTVACVDGEWHALPARLLSEVLRLRGWRVDYLGAQVPGPHLIAHLHRTGSDVVALSSSLPTRLPTAHATIAACQATGTPVLVGGAAFGSDGRFARLLGADGWAPDARTAAEWLSGELPLSKSGHLTIDGLPHLSDQEYTLVARSAPRLVRETVTRLIDRFPGNPGFASPHTAEDIAHIVEFLATALYVDDARMFGDFMEWTAGILTARGVPASVLTPTLDELAAQLTDFPRATGMISRALLQLSSGGQAQAPAPEPGKPV